jgi:hypothetical protein
MTSMRKLLLLPVTLPLAAAREVLDRLVGADEATLGVVRLYESATRNRATILRETEA